MAKRQKKPGDEIERLIAEVSIAGVLEMIAVALEGREYQLLANQTRRLAFKVEKVLRK